MSAARVPSPAETVQRFGTVRLFGAPPIKSARLFRLTDDAATMERIADAVVTRQTMDRPQWQGRAGDPARRTGGVYDASGTAVPTSGRSGLDPARLLVTSADPPRLEPGRREAAERLVGQHVYAGELKTHFGHFLLESLCRAWCFADRPAGARIIFHAAKGDPASALLPFMRALLAPLGIGPDDIILANRDLAVEELMLPSSQYDIGVRCDRSYATLFDRLRDRLAPPDAQRGPRRIYLTRRLVDARARQQLDRLARPEPVRERSLAKSLANEAVVEAMFMKRGFTVVAPETLPVAEQVRLVAEAEVLAGATGTALHHALFCTRPDARIVSVATRFSPNQVAVEQIKGLDAAHLFCARGRIPGEAVEIVPDRLATLLDGIGL